VSVLARPVVWGNLLYLGVAASLLCFYFWNIVIKKLGAVRTTNYVYFAPPVTLIASALVLKEPITWIALLGAALILAGVIQADRSAK
jgi:drug/metabolite transporter (DMT)-like permease